MIPMVSLVMFLAVLALGSSAVADGPAELLTSATDRVMEVLHDPSLRQPGRADERRDQIRSIVDGVFDWREACRQVLSRHWESLSQIDREQFTTLFSDVVLRSYLGLIQTHQPDDMTMVLVQEAIDGERAAVRAKLVSRTSAVPITYRLIGHERAWKIYDVAIDGVSVLSSSQSQIGRLIQRFGYGGMMTMLRMKQSQLLGGQQERSANIDARVDATP